MDASFIPIEVVPSKTPFGLDQLRRSYKTSLSAADAIAACPAVGTADETFEFMFLMPIGTPESAESATRVDLVYQGCLQGEGEPTLPAQKHDTDTSVQSATSSKSDDGRTLDPPLTVQYYGPSTTLTYFSYLAPGTETAGEPADDPEIITVVLNDLSFTGGSAGIPGLVAAFFDIQTVETHSSTEIVPGKYYQNTSRKTKVYVPFVADVPPGPYVIVENAGHDYVPGDTITIGGGGGTSVIEVASVFNSDVVGQIWAIHQVSSTATDPATGLTGTGGSGTGALFGIIIIA